MQPSEIIIGRLYRNTYVEEAIGSKVIYKGKRKGRDGKCLVIVDGVGKGQEVKGINPHLNPHFWNSFISNDATKVADTMTELLSTLGRKEFVAQIEKIATDSKNNLVLRATAKKLLEQIK